MPNQIIKFAKLKPEAKVPTRGSEYSAGYDLYACIDGGSKYDGIAIAPHETVKVSTGLSFELPNGYFGAIFARSGLATKQGLRPANCVGVCDQDYRGEYIVALHNDTDETQIIEYGNRIAQLVIMPYLDAELVENELSETDRGTNGFGSTGR